jgi:hypothetical protein
MTPRTDPDEGPMKERIGGRPVLRRIGSAAPAIAVVVVAGAAGLLWAGDPVDGAGTVPPPCPAALPAAADRFADTRDAEPGRLVPYPLPQPRGPVAVRLCRYASATAGAALERSTALDPPRTARLAGVLDTPGPDAVAGTDRPAFCAPSGPITVLLFRYTAGAGFVVDVEAGPCALVSTPQRVERNRDDVRELVDAALA